jgi:hypothetical protein
MFVILTVANPLSGVTTIPELKWEYGSVASSFYCLSAWHLQGSWGVACTSQLTPVWFYLYVCSYVYFWVWTVVLMLGIMGYLRYKLHYSLLRALKTQ